MTDHFEGNDVGVRVVRSIYRDLYIDDEWALTGERGLVWIGRRLPQEIFATPVVRDQGYEISQIHCITHAIENVRVSDETVARALTLLNQGAVGSAYVFDATARTVRLVLAHNVHEEIAQDRAQLVGALAILQLCEAEQRIDELANVLNGTPASLMRWGLAERNPADEMLEIWRRFREEGEQPSRFAVAEEMTGIAESTRGSPYASLGGSETGVSIEVPFGIAMTTLIEIRTDVDHPWLGSGCALRTTVPVPLSAADSATVARVQALQLETINGGIPCGAWFSGAHRSQPYLTWTRFLPNMLYRPNMVVNAAQGEVMRAIWIDRLMYSELPARNAWAVLESRFRSRGGTESPVSYEH